MTTEATNKRSLVAAFLYLACIVLANAALTLYGMVPLLGFGPLVPSGVYFAGLTFGVRDSLQEYGGRRWVGVAILGGVALSYAIEPAFALASAAAFGLSEAVDMAVYEPLRRRHWVAAVVLSNTVGASVDSAMFLYLAFGDQAGWAWLTLGKALMTVATLPAVSAARRRR